MCQLGEGAGDLEFVHFKLPGDRHGTKRTFRALQQVHDSSCDRRSDRLLVTVVGSLGGESESTIGTVVQIRKQVNEILSPFLLLNSAPCCRQLKEGPGQKRAVRLIADALDRCDDRRLCFGIRVVGELPKEAA